MPRELNLKCTDEWSAHLQELAWAAKLPTKAAVVDEAIRLLSELLGLPSVERIPPGSAGSHPHLTIRLDRSKLRTDVLLTNQSPRP